MTISDWLERRGAERRWRDRNREVDELGQCQCGAPGVVKVTDSFRVIGRVQPHWWRCAEHADVPLSVPWEQRGDTFVPQWHQSPDQCSWITASSATGIISDCGCKEHVGTPESDWRVRA